LLFSAGLEAALTGDSNKAAGYQSFFIDKVEAVSKPCPDYVSAQSISFGTASVYSWI
jgi:hypothetical protein